MRIHLGYRSNDCLRTSMATLTWLARCKCGTKASPNAPNRTKRTQMLQKQMSKEK